MRMSMLLALLLLSSIIISGCSAKRELKSAVCIPKSQPAENKCYERLAIDSKDPTPCDRIKTLKTLNGSVTFPTQVSCYSQVAFWRGDPSVCFTLQSDDEKFECKHRFELYVDAARVS